MSSFFELIIKCHFMCSLQSSLFPNRKWNYHTTLINIRPSQLFIHYIVQPPLDASQISKKIKNEYPILIDWWSRWSHFQSSNSLFCSDFWTKRTYLSYPQKENDWPSQYPAVSTAEYQHGLHFYIRLWFFNSSP